MTNKTEVKNLTKRADEVKLVLLKMIQTIETAKTEATDTPWWDEKSNILEGALTEVSARCSNLGYDITLWSSDTILTRSDLD